MTIINPTVVAAVGNSVWLCRRLPLPHVCHHTVINYNLGYIYTTNCACRRLHLCRHYTSIAFCASNPACSSSRSALNTGHLRTSCPIA